MGIAMTHWEGMTIDTDIPPIAGIVAFGTLTGPVIGWTSMAGLAITLPTVIEIGWLPGIGRVTVRTLSLEVVIWPIMARLAIWKAIVIKSPPLPRNW